MKFLSNPEVDLQGVDFNNLLGADEDERAEITEHLLVEILSEPEDNLIHTFLLGEHQSGNVIDVVRRTGDAVQFIKAKEIKDDFVVVAQAEGRDAVLLKCEECNINSTEGLRSGVIVLRYLHNGITNSYRNFSMDLRKVENIWNLYKKDTDTIIERLTLKSRKIFGRIIGIDDVVINSSFTHINEDEDEDGPHATIDI
jgi:hypothetical protein